MHRRACNGGLYAKVSPLTNGSKRERRRGEGWAAHPVLTATTIAYQRYGMCVSERAHISGYLSMIVVYFAGYFLSASGDEGE